MAHLRACIAAAAFAIARGVGRSCRRADPRRRRSPRSRSGASPGVPTDAASIVTAVAHDTVREGEATRWSATIDPASRIDVAVARLGLDDRWQLSPANGIAAVVPDAAVVLGADASPLVVDIGVRSVQWGRRDLGPCLVAASSVWGAFRVGPVSTEPKVLTTLPLPTLFDTAASVPSPAGLVGLHRSRRRGEGTEFATIRPFTVGDRLRRIDWPVSLRTRVLHVATTYVDSDTDVLLVVDATVDAGTSGGVDGASSSLDRSVRGAGAIAAHFLRHGDGVALRTIGSTRPAQARWAPARGTFAVCSANWPCSSRARPSGGALGRATQLAQIGFVGGGLAIVLSPLLSSTALDEAVALVRHGLIVLVVDTFPDEPPRDADDPTRRPGLADPPARTRRRRPPAAGGRGARRALARAGHRRSGAARSRATRCRTTDGAPMRRRWSVRELTAPLDVATSFLRLQPGPRSCVLGGAAAGGRRRGRCVRWPAGMAGLGSDRARVGGCAAARHGARVVLRRRVRVGVARPGRARRGPVGRCLPRSASARSTSRPPQHPSCHPKAACHGR